MTLLTLTFQNGQLLSHTARSARVQRKSSIRNAGVTGSRGPLAISGGQKMRKAKLTSKILSLIHCASSPSPMSLFVSRALSTWRS